MRKNLSDDDIQFIMDLLKAELNFGKIEHEKLGIPDNGYIYHMIDETQDRSVEFIRTQEFLESILNNNLKIFNPTDSFHFINYGDTELVYVIEQAGNKSTILVGQPNIKFGTVKREYDNLVKLSKKNPNLVIAPTNYFCNEYREAYLTPYIYQARCFASQNFGYGAYIPDPSYHFATYSDDDTYLICKAIIANLILLYDEKENLGLGACKIGGGDFILEKEFDNEIHTIENTLRRMHLIAARELISIDLDSYIKLLKEEFSQRTYYKNLSEKDPNILVNYKNRKPMSMEAIEDGIQLGLKLKR